MCTNSLSICSYNVYKEVWSASVGDVLQSEREAKTREDHHTVSIMTDGLKFSMLHAPFPEILRV